MVCTSRCLPGSRWGVVAAVVAGWTIPGVVCAAALEDAQEMLRTGAYEEAVAFVEDERRDSIFGVSWREVQIDGLTASGRYPEAWTAATNGLARHPRSIRLWWRAREVAFLNGDTEAAAEALDQIGFYVNLRADLYRDTLDRVVIGRAALAQGADPKLVLDRIYKPVRDEEPELRDIYLAAGDLALEKNDFELAAQWFRDGLATIPENPDLLCGLARAYAPSESALMMESAAAALAINAHHAGSLVLMAEHQITAENYEGATELLDAVLAVNPWHAEAWAYHAVIAHLHEDPDREATARGNALRYGAANPRVDHLIGAKLSEKYRFSEGAAYQVRALEIDPTYLPAKKQFAQDLLRLGIEEQGWEMAQAVQVADGYDITAANLVTLQDVLRGYTALTNQNFVLRIHPDEAPLYGRRALDLLEEAHQTLGERYDLRPADPVLVEIFQEQQDFAVRTFGMPLNQGFLGVCFGRVVTANSPGSRAGLRFNWESMLWHEYCHVVTLQMTNNKMPRWLSEGISVYEERARDSSWGEQLTPAYREMLLADDLTPVSQLSASFLTPRSSEHLMFAYYQSSLVVEYLVETFGRDALLGILHDLGDGITMAAALERNAAPLEKLDAEFAAYARQTALGLGPGLDWTRPEMLGRSFPEPPGRSTPGPSPPTVGTGASTNLWVLLEEARGLLRQDRAPEAQALLHRLIEAYPEQTGPDSAYALLAESFRAQGLVDQERETLAALIARDDEAVEACQRHLELAAEAKDWESVWTSAGRFLAVNPLIPLPHRYRAEAARHLHRIDSEIAARRALLHLDPANPAAVRFALARALRDAGERAEAKRQVLSALEDAPRYREALNLLLDLQTPDPTAATTPSAAPVRSGLASPIPAVPKELGPG